MIIPFGRKTFKSIREYPDTWAVGNADHEGKPMFVRFRLWLKEAVGHPEYPFQIGVATPLLSPNELGLATDDEAEVLYRIEDRLSEALTANDDAIFALAITTGGMREFVFYAKSWNPEELEAKVKALDSEGHELQFLMKEDAGWSIFVEFTK